MVRTDLSGTSIASNQHDASRLLQRESVPDVFEEDRAGGADLPDEFVVVSLDIHALVGGLVVWSECVEVRFGVSWCVLVQEVPCSDDARS